MENDKEKLSQIKVRDEKERKIIEKKFIDRILSITDEDIAQMDYKERQQYYKDKRRIIKVSYKGGNIPYRKPKEAQSER